VLAISDWELPLGSAARTATFGAVVCVCWLMYVFAPHDDAE
jgi:hypothetical protein